MKQFIHLHVHSAYSLAEGAIKVKDLVKLCAAQGMPAVAVTDSNNMFGALEFAMEAAANGVQPILGAQLLYTEGEYQIVLLVQNEVGYRNLCRLISDAYMDGEANHVVISRAQIREYSEGLIALSGGSKGPVNQMLLHKQSEKAEEEFLYLKACFGDRFYAEVQRHGWEQEEASEEGLLELAYKHDVPLVATNDCYFTDRKAHEAHDALLCISEGRYVSEEDRRKVTPEHYFKSAKEMEAVFADLPEALANTLVIAKRCSYLLQPIDPILPAFDTSGGRTEVQELRAQAEEGLKWRLENFVLPAWRHPETSQTLKDLVDDPSDPSAQALQDDICRPYWERLEFELKTIEDMGFPGYFLIVSDFIKWAKEQDIPVGPGRGSGGGSVVAWALKITDLDPLALNLLFERFLNPERVSMPDFDIDFCQERREEVIKYVQGKYGRDRVAQIITFGKLQVRNTVRDVGRVLQMSYGQVDRLAKLIPNNPANPTTLQEALDADPDLRLEIKKDSTSIRLIEIALQLEGLYRHASTHAAGVVIGDRPLHELVPLYRDPRSDMPVTQFNMKYVEQAGLVKFDFLGLKTMTVIHKACQMIKANRGVDVDVLELPFDDEKTFEMLKVGNNIGVFQVESSGMRDLGKQIGISNLEELLAVIALYRPGPMENIPVYLQNVKHEDQIDYMHEKLKPITQDTYGVMIYQEQVMQAAQVLAGYTLGGADLLRRAMGKKIKEEMDAQREMFVKGANDNNQIPESQANHIFDQIAAFAGYGFNKAHTAGYGLVSYWTGWLKANYPLEFMAASMTLDAGNTDKLSVFKQELDRMGVELVPPDINKSEVDFVVEGDGIRYALCALKGVGASAMTALVAERRQNGPYVSIEDFASRLNYKVMNKRQLEGLAASGGFDSLNPNRAQVLEGAEVILRHAQSLADEKESGQVSLFGGVDETDGLGMPELPKVEAWDQLERLAREFKAVGFYLSAHPLDSREQQFANLGISSVVDVEAALQNVQAKKFYMAGVLLKKQERMSQKGSKFAFLQMSDPTGIYEVMMFSELLTASREHLVPGNALLISVEAESKEDQVRYMCSSVKPLEAALETKIREIDIHLTCSEPVYKLKEFLDSEGQGTALINLHIRVDDRRIAHVQLPGRWNLSAQTRNAMRAYDGVSEILEA